MRKRFVQFLGVVLFLLAVIPDAAAQTTEASFNIGPTGFRILSLGSLTLTLNSDRTITVDVSTSTGGIYFVAFNVVGGSEGMSVTGLPSGYTTSLQFASDLGTFNAGVFNFSSSSPTPFPLLSNISFNISQPAGFTSTSQLVGLSSVGTQGNGSPTIQTDFALGTCTGTPGQFSCQQGGGDPCSSPPSFIEAVENGVILPSLASGDIRTSFQPGCGLTLTEAAQLGGYDHFNWVQVITEHDGLAACESYDDDWPYFPVFPSLPCLGVINLLTQFATFPSTPFFDVPAGGFAYQLYACNLSPYSTKPCLFPVRDALPWYWDEQYTDFGQLPMGLFLPEIDAEKTSCAGVSDCRQLQFEDEPSCNELLGPSPCIIRFTTTLVGVRPGGSGDALNLAACQAGLPLGCQNNVGTGFNWHVSGQSDTVDGRLQNFQPDPDTAVFFDGFKTPGAAGFTQPELELFAKNGINIRGEEGITIPVIIDIEPGESPNSINPDNQGTIPVAIISTTAFNASQQVDQNTLTFGHTGSEASLSSCHAEDVNGDGLLDLVCHFYTSTAAFQPGDTQGILKGKTLGRTHIFGVDSVQIVPPR